MVGDGSRGWWLQAPLALKVLAAKEIIQLVLRAAQLEARLQGGVLAPVHVEVAPIEGDAALGVDVDDARRPVTVFGRQGPGQKIDVSRKARTQHRAKAGNALGELNAVDPRL